MLCRGGIILTPLCDVIYRFYRFIVFFITTLSSAKQLTYVISDPTNTAKAVDIPYFIHDSCRCQCKENDFKKCNQYEVLDPIFCRCTCPTRHNVTCPIDKMVSCLENLF